MSTETDRTDAASNSLDRLKRQAEDIYLKIYERVGIPPSRRDPSEEWFLIARYYHARCRIISRQGIDTNKALRDLTQEVNRMVFDLTGNWLSL